MTGQRWWATDRLRRIRRGVIMGMYHQSAGYSMRYDSLTFLRDTGMRTLTDYERGLVHGYTAPQNRFRPVSR